MQRNVHKKRPFVYIYLYYKKNEKPCQLHKAILGVERKAKIDTFFVHRKGLYTREQLRRARKFAGERKKKCTKPSHRQTICAIIETNKPLQRPENRPAKMEECLQWIDY